MTRAVCATLLAAAFLAGCSSSAPEPIQVQHNLVSVDNQTSRDWLDVEIWINRQYRITVRQIAAHSRFTTTLDVFVAGFGQRFDWRAQRVDDLRLKAREPDGTPVEILLGGPRRSGAGRQGAGT